MDGNKATQIFNELNAFLEQLGNKYSITFEKLPVRWRQISGEHGELFIENIKGMEK